MYYGILGVTFIAFSCSTELIPEVNEKMKLVPFSDEFKFTMTMVMIVDYLGCWIIEQGLKRLFSDYRPKDIAVRRKDQIEPEEKRKQEDVQKREKEEQLKTARAVEDFEKKISGPKATAVHR